MTTMQTAAGDPPANSAARKTVIREVSDAIMPLEAQIDQIREKIKEHRAALKSNGIRAQVFNVAHHIRKLDDDVKRDQYRSDYEEAFEALDIGQQLNFLDVEEKRKKEEAERAHAIEQAEFNGHEAGRAGRPRACTYPPGSPQEAAWLQAYDMEQATNREAIGQA